MDPVGLVIIGNCIDSKALAAAPMNRQTMVMPLGTKHMSRMYNKHIIRIRMNI